MRICLTYLIILAFLMIAFASGGQNGIAKCRRSTEGREFWFGFMESRNHNPNHRVEITVTAREDANFSVFVGKSVTPVYTGTVSANNKVQVLLDWKMVEALGSESVQNKAIHLTSDKPVNLYALNWDQNSSDVAVIYPTESLGSEYFAMCFDPNVRERAGGAYGDGRNSEFLIVATEDSTLVKIKPSVVTDGLRMKDSVFTVKLNKGELYQVQSYNRVSNTGQGDLTGSYVTSDKPVAFYSGSLSTTVPFGSCCWDHLYEQIPPVKAWGRDFYAVPLLSRQADLYRVIASQDNTQIFIGNRPVVTLDKGEWHEFILTYTEPTRIFADKPVMVAQFSQSRDTDRNFTGGNGDPFMIILSPVTQAVNDVTFVAYTSNQIVKYYINVVTLTSEVNNIELSGGNMGSQFKPFPGTKYSYAQITVSQGTYRLRNVNPDRGFLAYVYGFGGVESYGYGVGFNLDLVLDIGESINFQGDTLAVCEGKTLNLDAGPYFDNYSWSTGDSTQELAASQEGLYKITASTVDGCIQHDSIYLMVNRPRIDLGPDKSGCSPFSVTLDGGSGFESYVWSTGDTTQSLYTDKTDLYHLEVKDWLGCPARDTMKLTVFPVPKVDLSGPDLVCGEENALLAVAFSGTADSVWQKGTFTWESNQPGKLTFRDPAYSAAGMEVSGWGEYEVKYLLVTPDGCKSGDDIKTAFWQTPTSAFEFIEDPGDKCSGYSREVLYEGNASPAANFSWDYGGCTRTDSIDWDRMRVSLGAFSSNPFLTLSVEEHGCYSDTTRKPIGANPDFRMNTLKSRGCDSARIFFSGDLKVPDALTFEWNFGDGSPISYEEKPSHLYDKVGNYDVRLQITNELTGCQIGFLIDSMVRIFPTPVAKISTDPVVCYGDTLPVHYVGNIDSSFCTWNFDGAQKVGTGNDSIVIRLEKPIAVIRLQTEEFGCVSKWTETTVRRKPLFDFLTEPEEGCQPLPVTLTALTADPLLSYSWLLDTLTLAGEMQTVVFGDTGKITLALAALSTETGCRDTLFKPEWVWVHPKPLAAFEVDFPVALLGQSNLSFTNLSEIADKFHWDFGEGNSSSEISPKHNFSELGKFPVTLEVETDFGCLDTAFLDIEILPDKVFTPNAFRPDSPIAENREFSPINVGVDPEWFHITIFNRWGAVVFESKSLENKWDGRLKNGQQAPPGNYVWKVEYTDIQGFQHTRQGQVLLVR